MRSILFVDDEPRLLAGMERALRSKRREWSLRFAGSGPEALLKLEMEPADVVVSDFRMPEMNGAELLQQVRTRHPGTMRFMLSGQLDRLTGLQALPVAHQFLAKPCDPGVLIGTIERACRLQEVVSSDVVRNVSASIGSLPPNPDVYLRLSWAIADERTTLQTISSIIEEDVSVTMKVLQLANSAYFGHVQKVDSVREAIQSLGIDLLRQMVLAAEVFERPVEGGCAAGFSRQALQQHAMLAARIARKILAAPSLLYPSSVAALLHDIGQLILATEMPQQYGRVLQAWGRGDAPLIEVERSLLGTSHDEVGAYLAGLWGFPEMKVRAIQNHHTPMAELAPDIIDANGKVTDLTVIVQLADHLAGERESVLPECVFAGHMDGWRAQAEKLKETN